jgi:tetratricopeptide (TPR) repeat protein
VTTARARRRLLAGFLACIFTCVGLASEEVEELRARLPSVEGSERIEVLNDLALAIQSTSPREAIEYAEQALELAQQSSDERGRVEAILNIGVARYFLAEYDVALEHYEHARSLAKQLEDDGLLSNALNNIGITSSTISVGSTTVLWSITNRRSRCANGSATSASSRHRSTTWGTCTTRRARSRRPSTC